MERKVVLLVVLCLFKKIKGAIASEYEVVLRLLVTFFGVRLAFF